MSVSIIENKSKKVLLKDLDDYTIAIIETGTQIGCVGIKFKNNFIYLDGSDSYKDIPDHNTVLARPLQDGTILEVIVSKFEI